MLESQNGISTPVLWSERKNSTRSCLMKTHFLAGFAAFTLPLLICERRVDGDIFKNVAAWFKSKVSSEFSFLIILICNSQKVKPFSFLEK